MSVWCTQRENQIMAAGTVYTNKELPHYKGQEKINRQITK